MCTPFCDDANLIFSKGVKSENFLPSVFTSTSSSTGSGVGKSEILLSGNSIPCISSSSSKISSSKISRNSEASSFQSRTLLNQDIA